MICSMTMRDAAMTDSTVPETSTTRSWVPGKVSVEPDTLIRTPVVSLMLLMVAPPFPITVPAALLATRIFRADPGMSRDCRLFGSPAPPSWVRLRSLPVGRRGRGGCKVREDAAGIGIPCRLGRKGRKERKEEGRGQRQGKEGRGEGVGKEGDHHRTSGK